MSTAEQLSKADTYAARCVCVYVCVCVRVCVRACVYNTAKAGEANNFLGRLKN